jgi:nucleoside-diphosphate-sugar epimerase
VTQALIGHTGFVGSNLARDDTFEALFNSSNIAEIAGRHFDRIVCAGIPAAKWLANQKPDEDRRNIARLTAALGGVTTDRFVLISTIDVYPRPLGVDEGDTPAVEDVPEPYGRHRLEFEHFARQRFPRSHVLRLPALFGPGLKKNAVYDLVHDNRLEWVHPDGVFQWYPVARLARDIALVEQAGIDVVNLATEPLAMGDIQARFFPNKRLGGKVDKAARYDFRTRHGRLWGRSDGYCLGEREILAALAEFLPSDERR